MTITLVGCVELFQKSDCQLLPKATMCLSLATISQQKKNFFARTRSSTYSKTALLYLFAGWSSSQRNDTGYLRVSTRVFSNFLLKEKAIMSHMLSPGTDILLGRRFRLQVCDKDLKLLVSWKDLSIAKDTVWHPNRVHVDVPQMFERLLESKNTPATLAPQARCVIDH